jgi:DNA-binding CsgD family transcriptional regulator
VRYSLVPMAPDGTTETFTLRQYLRACVDSIAASFDAAAGAPGGSPKRRALERFLRALDELGAATAGLAQRSDDSSAQPAPTVLIAGATLADEIRKAECEPVLVQASPEPAAIAAALERRPALLVVEGLEAAEWISRLRELQPGLPAIVVVDDQVATRAVERFASEPVLIIRSSARAELPLTVRALVAVQRSHPLLEEGGVAPIDPRSYAHLAGLLPRALERTIAFDVGASVIARPGGAPITDVYSPAGSPSETVEWVRHRALALYGIVRGGAKQEGSSAADGAPPVRSCLYSPLATGGVVVGLTYLASLKENAFTEDDERILSSLATHASGAYRRLEASLHQLRLSPRQSQVLALIASGLSDKEVASRLGLAHRTVRTHVDRMLREHGLRSRTEAVAAWLRGQQT